jgi:mono/diheme cytochrome c family protein
MKSSSNRLEWLLLIATGLTLVIILFVYVVAESDMRQQYDVPLEAVEIPIGAAAITEGERLATIRGCFWCHGQFLEGQKYFADEKRGIIAIAPDLTRKVREYTPAEFARAVRHGVKSDGTSVQPAMPSFAFYNMSNADMGAIIAYIQSLPEQNGFLGQFRLLPVGWFRMAAGKLPPAAAVLIDHNAPRPDSAVKGDQVERGRYLAESICTECHGDNGRLRVPNTPDLQIAAAYTRDDFFRLMRTGAPIGDRKIDYHMVDVSKYRYIRLTDSEVDALHAYFRAMLEPDFNSGS